jgi:hypothetical protein
MLVRQPSVPLSPEQNAQPELQLPRKHRPFSQTGRLFVTGHAFPHRPQLSGSVIVLVAHDPGQTPGAPGQATHAPLMHTSPDAQGAPHAPQWVALARRSVSQPLAALPSQSP